MFYNVVLGGEDVEIVPGLAEIAAVVDGNPITPCAAE